MPSLPVVVVAPVRRRALPQPWRYRPPRPMVAPLLCWHRPSRLMALRSTLRHRSNDACHTEGKTSRRGPRALDLLNFFVADVQTGFGPFVAVYLTTNKWTQVEIGFALTLGTVVALIMPDPRWSTGRRRA